MQQSAYSLSRCRDSEKRLLGMPMSLAVLTCENNWINQRRLQELAGSKMVSERDCVVHKIEVAKL